MACQVRIIAKGGRGRPKPPPCLPPVSGVSLLVRIQPKLIAELVDRRSRDSAVIGNLADGLLAFLEPFGGPGAAGIGHTIEAVDLFDRFGDLDAEQAAGPLNHIGRGVELVGLAAKLFSGFRDVLVGLCDVHVGFLFEVTLANHRVSGEWTLSMNHP